MNPLDYTSPDAFTRTWAPPISVVRSLGPHVCVVQPHHSRMPVVPASPTSKESADAVMCTGRIRTHLPTPHSGSCPLDYTSLFVTLHRRQKEKVLQVHASRPVPFLGRYPHVPAPQPTQTGKASECQQHTIRTARRAAPVPSQNEDVSPAGVPARTSRASMAPQHSAVPDSLAVVERAVPPSVAAAMAHLIAPATASTTAAQPRTSFSSPPHHHHHHHHSRPSAETRAPSTQQSPVLSQHHHHHYQHQQQQQQVTPGRPSVTETSSPSTREPQVVAQQLQQHMRYRVGRSGSTQLQTLPATNGEAVSVGAAALVAAAAAEAAARGVAASVRRAASHRRSTSPFSSLPSSASTSMPRETSTTPLSLALSSIRRSGTRGSASTLTGVMGLGASTTSTGVVAAASAAAGSLTRLPHLTARSFLRNSLPRSASRHSGDDVADAAPVATELRTPNDLADTRMFLRPPQHALREGRDFGSDSFHASVLLAGSPGTASTLYRSGVAVAVADAGDATGAGAATAEQQGELQLQLQRALQRQRRLERLMFHDGEDDTAGDGVDEEECDVDSGDGTEGRRSAHTCRSGTGWDDGLVNEEAAEDAEPLWRASPSAQSLLSPNTAAAAHQPPQAVQPQQTREDRVLSVHPHEHISLHRFQEPTEEGGSVAGIRADSVLDVPRGWGILGRGRSSTTSPSPQPDPSWARRQHPPKPQRYHAHLSRYQPSGSPTVVAEGSPVPVPAAEQHRLAASSTPTSTAAAATAGTTTVSRSAAVAPTSAERSGNDADAQAAHTPASLLSVATADLRGPSSMSYISPSVSRHRDAVHAVTTGKRGEPQLSRQREHDGAAAGAESVAQVSATGSPTPPSPALPGLKNRPSMPSAAFIDVVGGVPMWKQQSESDAAPAAVSRHSHRSSSSSSAPSWRCDSPPMDTRSVAIARQRRKTSSSSGDTHHNNEDDDGIACMAEVRAEECTAKDVMDRPHPFRPSSPFSPSHPTAAEARGARAARWSGRATSEMQRRDEADGNVSPSLPPSYGAASASPTTKRYTEARTALSEKGSLGFVEGLPQEDAHNDVPAVRRTSPGVSEEASSKCTRFSADDYRSSSSARSSRSRCASPSGSAEGQDVGRGRGTSECNADRYHTASSSTSPSPPLVSPIQKALGAAMVNSSCTQTAVRVPMVYLSDMLRLSFSPTHDDNDENDACADSNNGTPQRYDEAESGAATPLYCTRRDACERDPPYPASLCDARVTTGERSGVTTASISSSPPSPNRTAIRHVVSSITDEDGIDRQLNTSPMSTPSPFRRRTPGPPQPASGRWIMARASTPLTPTAVANHLALSFDDRRLHASTASTVAWGTVPSFSATPASGAAAAAAVERTSLAQPRFSDESTLSATTEARLTSATSTRSSVSAVFSTPAQTRLKSLLRASTWAAATSTPVNMEESHVDSEMGEEERANAMRTPPRHVTSNAYARDSLSRSPATPLHGMCHQDAGASTGEATSLGDSTMTMTAMRPPPAMEPPSSFTSMPPPQSSPFRGSGSFLRVQPSWSGCPTTTADEGRPSDSFKADIQLLARMTRMTVETGPASTSAMPAPSTYLATPKQSRERPHQHHPQQEQQLQPPSPSSSPGRFSSNSLSFFLAAAASAGSPAATADETGDDQAAPQRGSGVYGSALALRRSWAPRKGSPKRRGKQRRQRCSGSGGGSGFVSPSHASDAYHQLRFTSELTSSSPSARPSREGSTSTFLAPQRLTFGTATASVATQLTATTGGASDSGERWSTASSTPTATALARQQQQQQQQGPRVSPPSYFEALHTHRADTACEGHSSSQSRDRDGGAEDGPRSPSLVSMHYDEAAHRQRWQNPSSTASSVARTPSGRPSLSSSEFLHAPRRGRRDDRRRSSHTPSVNALPSYPLVLHGPADLKSSPQQRSLSASGESSEDRSHWQGGAPPRRARRAVSFSVLRSPSATGTRLTWGTATRDASSSEARADAFSLSPLHSARRRSPSSSVNFYSGSTTPLRVPRSRASGSMMDRFFAPPPPAPQQLTTATPAAPATTMSQPLTLADELRSFSSPIFSGPPPPPNTGLPGVATLPPAATTFLASPPRRTGASFLASPHRGTEGRTSAGSSSMSLPPELQALLLRGAAAAPVVAPAEAAATTPVKAPSQRRGCSERAEVNVESPPGNFSPPRQASP